MKAIDTNVLLRLLVGDDPVQQATAQELIKSPTFITISVLIETGWVLRSRYGFDRSHVVAFFEALFDHPTVTVQSRVHVLWALARYATTGDLADLLHIAGAVEAEAFATFDRGIAPSAGPNAPISIETLT